MELSYLTSQDWKEFGNKFSEAAEFLLSQALMRELAAIQEDEKKGKTSIYARVRQTEIKKMIVNGDKANQSDHCNHPQ